MSKNTYKPWLYSFFLLLAMALSACSPISKPDQPEQTSQVQLTNSDAYGQTFLAKYDGLSGLELFLIPNINDGGGELILNIYSGPYDTSDLLARGTLPVNKITSPGFYQIQFPTINNSTSTDYYLELKIDGHNQVNLGITYGDAYINGSLYHNGSPISNQLAFSLIYDPLRLSWGLFVEFLAWLWLMILGGWLFIIPGWATLSITLPNWASSRWSLKLGLSIGVSLALYPLLILWTNLLGLQLGSFYAWLPSLIGLFIILWRHRNNLSSLLKPGNLSSNFSHYRTAYSSTQKSLVDWLPDILLIFVFILLCLSRFWAIRNLDAPMWGDSYQHTMIAQLLVNNGGLFENWEPYVPYYSLTVHFGFHTAVALYTWLTGTDIVVGTMQIGQMINIFAIITLIPLAVRFSPHNRWTGLGVVIIAGLLSQMPAFYVNWGRYPQLAGQVILPVAIWLLWENAGLSHSTKNGYFSRRAVILVLITALVVSGMLLTYYRMGFYFLSFTLVWLAIYGILFWKYKLNAWLEVLIKLAAIAITSFLVILPWISRLSGSNLSSFVQAGVRTGSAWAPVLADFKIWNEIDIYTPIFVLVASIIALGLGTYKKNYILFILPIWYLLLSIYVAGKIIGTPGSNMLQNFTIIISIYIPLGLLAGWLVDEFGRSMEKRLNYFGTYLFSILVLLLAFSGTRSLRSIADPNTFALVTRPDMRAFSWINQNIPDGARFLVEGFRIYGGRTAVGSDAGWWISLLTKNENSMPPQYALINEVPSPPEYTKQIIDLVASLEDVSLESNDGTQVLCENNISHIYIGQGQGSTSMGAQQLFSPSEVGNNPDIELIYRHDKVYIFKLKQDTCE